MIFIFAALLINCTECILSFVPLYPHLHFLWIKTKISERPLEVLITLCTHTHTHISAVKTQVVITHSFITSCGCRCLSMIIHLQAFNHWSPHWFGPFRPSFPEIWPAVLSAVTVRSVYIPGAVTPAHIWGGDVLPWQPERSLGCLQRMNYIYLYIKNA